MSAAFTAGSDAFKLERESLQKQIDELKEENFYRQASESNAKLTILRQTHDVDVSALQEKLCDHDFSFEGLQLLLVTDAYTSDNVLNCRKVNLRFTMEPVLLQTFIKSFLVCASK